MIENNYDEIQKIRKLPESASAGQGAGNNFIATTGLLIGWRFNSACHKQAGARGR